MNRRELFEKFDNHYWAENEFEDNEYLVYLCTNPVKWSSYPYFKRDIRNYLREKYDKNATVLDIGCGSGTYYYLLKDYFNIIDGVEGDKNVIEGANLEQIYNKVFNIDACDFKFDFYDIIIIGDCLEHIEFSKALKLVEYLYSKCQELIIVVPYNLVMEADGDNPYSSHKQDDLSPTNMIDRYPMLKLKWGNEYIGVYTK